MSLLLMPAQDGSVDTETPSPQSHCSAPVRMASPQRGMQIERLVRRPLSVS
jgi:hypothetical protein